jgi:hypothetical protein
VTTVNVEATVPLAAGVTDAGEREQVTVELKGVIAQVNPTAELNPLNEVTVIVDAVVFPAAVVTVAGEALKLKSPTVNAKVAVRVCPPDAPLTVTV